MKRIGLLALAMLLGGSVALAGAAIFEGTAHSAQYGKPGHPDTQVIVQIVSGKGRGQSIGLALKCPGKGPRRRVAVRTRYVRIEHDYLGIRGKVKQKLGKRRIHIDFYAGYQGEDTLQGGFTAWTGGAKHYNQVKKKKQCIDLAEFTLTKQ